MSDPIPVPPGLGEAGVAFWEDVTRDYELNPSEVRLLEAACRELDLIERMQAIVAKLDDVDLLDPPKVVTELRLHRGIFDRLTKGFDLGESGNANPSAAGRNLVSHRWNKRGA